MVEYLQSFLLNYRLCITICITDLFLFVLLGGSLLSYIYMTNGGNTYGNEKRLNMNLHRKFQNTSNTKDRHHSTGKILSK